MRFFPSLLVLMAALHGTTWADPKPHTLLIVIDGLRPDYVMPELMPQLHALGERGVVGERHHAVYPTVTRVNASTFSTGAYPETHGLLENTVYFPEVDDRAMTTSNRANLVRIDEATGGKLLLAKTMGEHLQDAGKKLLAVSSGSSGSSFLLNHKVPGGAIIHVDYVLPESLGGDVMEAVGEVPEDAIPNRDRNRWMVDAYIKVGLDQLKPDVAYLWISDPDTTAHAFGVGHPKTVESLAAVDNEIGRIIAALDERDLLEHTDILITSDHGFSDHLRNASPDGLIAGVLKAHELSRRDYVSAGGAYYLSDAARPLLPEIVEKLQRAPFVGALFTPEKTPGSSEGIVPGTLSQSLVRWQHPRSSSLLVSPNWTDDENAYGFKGATTRSGIAGHGSSSPYDIHNTFIAAGPRIRAGVRSGVPSHNVDIAPTIAHLQGLDTLPDADGRILSEILADGPEAGDMEVSKHTHEVSHTLPDGTVYTLTAHESRVGDARYFDYTEVVRTAP